MNSDGPDGRYSTDQGVFQKLVMHAFGLPPSRREVFLLCDVKGLTIPEVAVLLGISSTMVRTGLAQARREVRARLSTGP